MREEGGGSQGKRDESHKEEEDLARLKWGRTETGDDAQQRMLSKTDSGRCWAGDVLSQMDNVRGDADSESC